MANKKNILITLLIVIIVVMAIVLAYVFLIRPGITGFVFQKQTEGFNIGYNQGIEFAISTIISQIQQNGFAQIPIGNGTLYLAPFNPQQAPVQQQLLE